MEKDINQPEESKKDIQVYEAVSSFIKDKDGIQVYRRSEKICKAYFLLTRHIADNESIKSKLRDSAIQLNSKTLELVAAVNKTEALSRQVVLEAVSLVSMSDMAATSGLISPSNYTVVVSQIEIFIAEIEKYWKSMSYGSQAIPSTLFDIEHLTVADSEALERENTNVSFIGHSQKTNIGGAKILYSNTHLGGPSGRSHEKKSHVAHVSHSVHPPARSSAHQPKIDEHKNERQTLIVDTIRAKGELSIKDLVGVIKGCSEKTIQRELIALVSSGTLLKTGERRWSKYSIGK